jgi:signal transduction histidine kinase
VIDTGCGMSEYVQAHIFEAMFTTKILRRTVTPQPRG